LRIRDMTLIHSEMNWQKKNFCSYPRVEKIQNAHLARMAEGCGDTRTGGSSKE
jgi:hypothetical protein